MRDETIPTIDPARTALLVMDYQAAILAAVPEADALLTRVAAAISIARSRGVQIGYVRVALDDADYDAVPQTNKGFAAAAAGRRMHVETPETAIHDAVAPQPGDLVVRKTRVGAFSTTDLHEQLRGSEDRHPDPRRHRHERRRALDRARRCRSRLPAVRARGRLLRP